MLTGTLNIDKWTFVHCGDPCSFYENRVNVTLDPSIAGVTWDRTSRTEYLYQIIDDMLEEVKNRSMIMDEVQFVFDYMMRRLSEIGSKTRHELGIKKKEVREYFRAVRNRMK